MRAFIHGGARSATPSLGDLAHDIATNVPAAERRRRFAIGLHEDGFELQSLPLLQAAARDCPDDLELAENIVCALNDLRRDEEVVALASAVLTQHPGSWRAPRNLILSLTALVRHAGVLEALEARPDQVAGDPFAPDDYRTDQAIALVGLGQIAEAESELARMDDPERYSAFLSCMQAIFALERGDCSAALALKAGRKTSALAKHLLPAVRFLAAHRAGRKDLPPRLHRRTLAKLRRQTGWHTWLNEIERLATSD